MSRTNSSIPRTPAALQRAEHAVQQWRENGGGTGFPIPESIWALAVTAARLVGVAEVVRVLRLNRRRLNQRVAAAAAADPVTPQAENANVEVVVAPDVTPRADAKARRTRATQPTTVAAPQPHAPQCWIPPSALEVEPDANPIFFELRIPVAEPQGPEPPAAVSGRVSDRPDAVIEGAVIECSGHGEHLRIELHTLSAATLNGIMQAFWSRSCCR